MPVRWVCEPLGVGLESVFSGVPWSCWCSWWSIVIRGWPGRLWILAALIWILDRGFESHRGGLCWSARVRDPRSPPRTQAPQVRAEETARGRQVPGQTLTPQLTYPPRLEGPIKTRRGPFLFGCVCVCGTSLLSRIVKCFSLIVHCILFVIKSALCLPS